MCLFGASRSGIFLRGEPAIRSYLTACIASIAKSWRVFANRSATPNLSTTRTQTVRIAAAIGAKIANF